jgi:hypothetical protein
MMSGQLVDLLRGADAGHDVFALGVHQELAEQLLFAGGGVARERDAGAGGVAHVAEDHLCTLTAVPQSEGMSFMRR